MLKIISFFAIFITFGPILEINRHKIRKNKKKKGKEKK